MEAGKPWPRPEQTAGKHLVLRHYLSGWLPILGSQHRRLLLVDGFAGPGEYADGWRGSPVIALDCVRGHREVGRLKGVEVLCLFVESDLRAAQHLKRVLKTRPSNPDETYEVLPGAFEDHVARVLEHIEHREHGLAPAFVMIDPFGVKGVRMASIARILANRRSECMVSFMYEAINRHKATDEFANHLDDLFGSPDWRKSLRMGSEKKRFLHDLFGQQLKRHGARHVVPFELWDRSRHVYTLFFASGSEKGCDLMKQCMWKVDRTGGYAFCGRMSTHATLFELGGINVKEPLADELKHAFGDRWTSIETIGKFVMGDATTFHKGQLRRLTLQPLEKEGRIDVRRPRGARGFSAGKGIKVRFL